MQTVLLHIEELENEKYEKEPVLWCEKHKKSVLCTEQHPCFIPECIPPKK
ncbi:MAG: hypothetical protein V8Q17_00215 [Acutalibacteraceae bacterium]